MEPAVPTLLSSSPSLPTAAPSGRGLRVAVGGSPYFGRKLAALLNGDGWRAAYLETRGWRPGPALRALVAARRADVLYQIGGQIGRFSRPALLLAATRRPMVMHWTGSDVLYAQRLDPGQRSRRLREGVTHWAGAPWLVEELAPIGVRATYQPHSAVDAPATLPPFPSDFTILAYVQPGREHFYGVDAVLAAARALPQVRFRIVGSNRVADPPANVAVTGWTDAMAAEYAGSHVLLRLPEHDGLAFMAQEALAFGRYVIWNHSYPYVTHAQSVEQAIAQLRLWADQHAAGALPLNKAGAAHVRAHHNSATIAASLRAGLLAAVEQRR